MLCLPPGEKGLVPSAEKTIESAQNLHIPFGADAMSIFLLVKKGVVAKTPDSQNQGILSKISGLFKNKD